MATSYVETTLQNENLCQPKADPIIFKWLWGQIHKEGTNTTGRSEQIVSPVHHTPMQMKSCNISCEPTLCGNNVQAEDTIIPRSLKNLYNSSLTPILETTPDENEPIAELHHVRWTSSICVYSIPAITRITRNERRGYQEKLNVQFESVIYVREIPARTNNDAII
jgi:hypothetical protein